MRNLRSPFPVVKICTVVALQHSVRGGILAAVDFARHLFLFRSHAAVEQIRAISACGDVDVDSLAVRMVCENTPTGTHGNLDVSRLAPTAGEAVGLKIRKLVAIKIRRIPVWKEE